jgi:hypothetical protein
MDEQELAAIEDLVDGLEIAQEWRAAEAIEALVAEVRRLQGLLEDLDQEAAWDYR